MESITHYVEQRLKLRVNRQKSAVAPAVERPLLGFEFFSRSGRGQSHGRPEGSQTSPGTYPSTDHAQLGRLDGAAGQGDQPLHGRMDGLLRVRRHPCRSRSSKVAGRRLRQVRWKEWKRPPTRRTSDALGIPDRDARSWAPRRRVTGASPGPDLQRALPNAYWTRPRPERIPRPLPPFPGMLSEPPGADPHAGWCGGGQGSPGPYPMCARHDQQLGGASPLWRRWHQPQAKGNCVVVRRGGKEAGGEIATRGTHGLDRRGGGLRV